MMAVALRERIVPRTAYGMLPRAQGRRVRFACGVISTAQGRVFRRRDLRENCPPKLSLSLDETGRYEPTAAKSIARGRGWRSSEPPPSQMRGRTTRRESTCCRSEDRAASATSVHLGAGACAWPEQAMQISQGFWRRRPDLNRGWRFCRFRWVLYLIDSSCSLASSVPPFQWCLGVRGLKLD
jgi:hypothetical protein